ncbi:MAG: DUF1801 domain-containing protein [Pseudomonadota bacterium]
MSQLKTRPGDADVDAFLTSVEDDQRRKDSFAMHEMMTRLSGEDPKIWGGGMVGYGSYTYDNVSGRGGEWFLTGFAPRKQALTIYIMDGFSDHETLMEKLGKYKIGKSCLYVKKLDDIDMKVLERLVKKSLAVMRKRYNA